jgi:hypothetical protein
MLLRLKSAGYPKSDLTSFRWLKSVILASFWQREISTWILTNLIKTDINSYQTLSPVTITLKKEPSWDYSRLDLHCQGCMYSEPVTKGGADLTLAEPRQHKARRQETAFRSIVQLCRVFVCFAVKLWRIILR